MKLAKRRLQLLVTLLVVSVVITMWSVGWLGIEESRRGESCIRCGTERTQGEHAFRLFQMRARVSGSSKIKPTSLTECWSRYVVSCEHDWAFHYLNTRRGSGKSFVDGFPYFRYPAASAVAADSFVPAIDWLDVPNARSNALVALGHRDNLLRFVAAEALRDVADGLRNDPRIWWSSNEMFFSVVTNKGRALALLDSWEKSEETRYQHVFEQSRDLIRETSR